jgi:hypothetical protein
VVELRGLAASGQISQAHPNPEFQRQPLTISLVHFSGPDTGIAAVRPRVTGYSLGSNPTGRKNGLGSVPRFVPKSAGGFLAKLACLSSAQPSLGSYFAESQRRGQGNLFFEIGPILAKIEFFYDPVSSLTLLLCKHISHSPLIQRRISAANRSS